MAVEHTGTNPTKCHLISKSVINRSKASKTGLNRTASAPWNVLYLTSELHEALDAYHKSQQLPTLIVSLVDMHPLTPVPLGRGQTNCGAMNRLLALAKRQVKLPTSTLADAPNH